MMYESNTQKHKVENKLDIKIFNNKITKMFTISFIQIHSNYISTIPITPTGKKNETKCSYDLYIL
jgi:hypothetical protein